MSLAEGNVLVSDGWTAGMQWRRNRSTALLCLLKDSDPLQWGGWWWGIRLMALVESKEKMLYISTLQQEETDKEMEREKLENEEESEEKKRTR